MPPIREHDMGDTSAWYRDERDGANDARDRAEVREWQRGRLIAIRLATALEDAARWQASLGPKYAGKTCRTLLSACVWFQFAGLTHRARVLWRYAQFVHRALRCGGRGHRQGGR